jgi:hypothetical protein
MDALRAELREDGSRHCPQLPADETPLDNQGALDAVHPELRRWIHLDAIAKAFNKVNSELDFSPLTRKSLGGRGLTLGSIS